MSAVEIGHAVRAHVERREGHARRWGLRLALATDEAEARVVLRDAVRDEAENVSKLDLDMMPAGLRTDYVAFVLMAVCTAALREAPDHPLAAGMHAAIARGQDVLERSGFIIELAYEIQRHAVARRVRAVAIALMREG